MAAPFRIEKSRPQINKGAMKGIAPAEKSIQTKEGVTSEDPNAGFKEYLGRLLKMIPGEIVGLYMIGSGFIPAGKPAILTIWSVVCLILLVILRLWGTADPAQGKPSQPIPVAIAAIAFVIWLYWLGGPFVQYGIYLNYVGSLLVLVWSFLIPIFYKGD